jgi:hypothetical protein
MPVRPLIVRQLVIRKKYRINYGRNGRLRIETQSQPRVNAGVNVPKVFDVRDTVYLVQILYIKTLMYLTIHPNNPLFATYSLATLHSRHGLRLVRLDRLQVGKRIRGLSLVAELRRAGRVPAYAMSFCRLALQLNLFANALPSTPVTPHVVVYAFLCPLKC